MIRSLFLILLLVGLFVSLIGTDVTVERESGVIPPDIVLNGVGDNVDTIAFWEGATPKETLMFVTSKADSLVEVWHFPFATDNEGQPIQHASFGTSQVNGVVVDQALNKLYVSVGEPAGVVTVFTLPDMAFEQVLVRAALGREPGIALYHWPDGRSWLYTTGDENNLLYVRDAATGAEIVTFDIGRELETVWGDEYHGVIYVPDEKGGTGVYAYTPEMGFYERNGRSIFGADDFQDDEEGILIYNCLTDGQDNGNGFIVVSDQRKPTSEFEFFDRVSWEYLGNLQLAGVGNTDGIASLRTSLPGYPLGVFAAINDDTDVALVGWDKIFAAMELSCDGQTVAPAMQPTAVLN
jgi:myo-inositol-hexaphosphate 3-phosphohydrolase